MRRVVFVCLCMALAVNARAQVQTGSIAGVVSDTSSAVLPGVTVTLTGEKLIGGAQVQATDGSGAYRFDRLPPGSYTIKFELQGFKTIESARPRDSRTRLRRRGVGAPRRTRCWPTIS